MRDENALLKSAIEVQTNLVFSRDRYLESEVNCRSVKISNLSWVECKQFFSLIGFNYVNVQTNVSKLSTRFKFDYENLENSTIIILITQFLVSLTANICCGAEMFYNLASECLVVVFSHHELLFQMQAPKELTICWILSNFQISFLLILRISFLPLPMSMSKNVFFKNLHKRITEKFIAWNLWFLI